MSVHLSLQKCKAYIDCHLRPPRTGAADDERRPPAVTISRQTGTGALSIAEELARRLQESPLRNAECEWTVFDKNLVTKVLEDHDLPERLAQYMPEDKVSYLADALEELFGLHPPSWNLVHQLTETILRLAELGNVILIGRAAPVITAKMPHVFHVRLVGSLERRVQRIQALQGIDHEAALDFIKRADAGRKRYVKQYFRSNIDDPLLYDLIINTDKLAEPEAAELICHAIVARFESRVQAMA